MTQRRKSWLKKIMKWVTGQIKHLLSWRLNIKDSIIFRRLGLRPFKSTSTLTESNQINVVGDHIQAIAVNKGTAINNVAQYVENLSQNFNGNLHEIIDLQRFWENWSLETVPPFSPSLIIGARENTKNAVIDWLRSNPSPFALQSDSPEEAIAFLAAVIQLLDDEERASNLSRAIVVYDITSWQNRVASSKPLILIANFNQPEGIGRAIKNGHHIFVPLGRGSTVGMNAVSLTRIVRSGAEQALIEMGLNRDRASELATLARRSLPALRRELAIVPAIQQPDWAQSREARYLLAPLLVSAWRNSYEGDREVLERLSGISYDSLQEKLVCWTNTTDSPIRRVGDVWMIAAHEDAWRLIARYLIEDDLKQFEKVAIDVLTELDPIFEMPPEQHLITSLYSKGLKRSGHIRNGISETLALMAALSSEIQFLGNRNGEQVVNTIVYQLLEKAKHNEHLWASAAYQLPLLAEAAPDIFLNAVDDSLKGDSPVLLFLFQDKDSDSALRASSPHTGLLWALETLAWNPDYLSRSALLLTRLAKLDPDGKFINRPINSLRDIFCCWHPNTTAFYKSRLTILDNIRRLEPEIAWHLLISLLPNDYSSVSPTHGATWRDWMPDDKTEVTHQEYFEITSTILEKLIIDSEFNATRWSNLISSISNLFPQQLEVFLKALEELDPNEFSAIERAKICDCLRSEISKHREYPNANWAISSLQVKRLESVYARFEPEELIEKYCWLFSNSVVMQGKNYISWEERERLAEKERSDALEEIISTRGPESILKLAQQVQEPKLVGQSLAVSDSLSIDFNLFLQKNLGSNEPWRSQMVQQFIRVNAYQKGVEWIDKYLISNREILTPEQYGEFLLCLPLNEYLQDKIDAENEEIQRYFWTKRKDIYFLELEQLQRLLSQLLRFRRPHLAVNIIVQAIEKCTNIILPERIAEVLELAVKTPVFIDEDVSLFPYLSAKLLDFLEKTDLLRERLAQLELLYLQVLEHQRPPQEIYKELSKNPSFFVEVLQVIFRSEEEQLNDIPDNAKQFAPIAWKLLDSWKQMPGVKSDDAVDAQALRTWIHGVRKLAAECGRTQVADIYIGHMLSFSPKDSDKTWPHQAVRDLIEELENTCIESGFRTQIFNNRGVTMRSITDGGQQEKSLAERYLQDSRQLNARWPRLASILKGLADDYFRQAEYHDQQAELTQDFW